MISELSTAGALPTLEAMLRFSGQRQRLIAHSIANFSTPGFVPVDLSPADFQRGLGEAVDERRGVNGGTTGELAWDGTREVRVGPGGAMEFRPSTFAGGVLGHDRNATDLERTLQDLVENAGVFRVASDFLRQQQSQLRAAIAERVL